MYRFEDVTSVESRHKVVVSLKRSQEMVFSRWMALGRSCVQPTADAMLRGH